MVHSWLVRTVLPIHLYPPGQGTERTQLWSHSQTCLNCLHILVITAMICLNHARTEIPTTDPACLSWGTCWKTGSGLRYLVVMYTSIHLKILTLIQQLNEEPALLILHVVLFLLSWFKIFIFRFCTCPCS